MTAKHYIISAFLLAISLAASAQEHWTMDQCIDYATANHIDVKRAVAEVQQKNAQAQAAARSFQPSIEANITPSVNYGLSMQLFVYGTFAYLPAYVQMEMPLIDKSLSLKRKSAQLQHEAAEASLFQTKTDVTLAIASYYMQVLYAKNVLKMTEEQLALDNENLSNVKAHISEGSIAESELTKAEIAVATSEKERLLAEGNVKVALLELKNVLGTDKDIDIADNMPEPQSKSVNTVPDVSSNYGIRAQQLALTSSKIELEAAKAGMKPRLTLGATTGTFSYYKWHSEGDFDYKHSPLKNFGAVTWVNLSIPIYDRRDTRYAVQAAESAVSLRESELEQSERALKTNILKVSTMADNSLSQYRKAQEVSQKSNESYNYELERYNGGYSSWADLQEAKRAMKVAKLDEITVYHKYLLYKKQLEVLK